MNWMMQNSIRATFLGVVHNLLNKKFSIVVIVEIILITILITLLVMYPFIVDKEQKIRDEYETTHIVPLDNNGIIKYKMINL